MPDPDLQRLMGNTSDKLAAAISDHSSVPLRAKKWNELLGEEDLLRRALAFAVKNPGESASRAFVKGCWRELKTTDVRPWMEQRLRALGLANATQMVVSREEPVFTDRPGVREEELSVSRFNRHQMEAHVRALVATAGAAIAYQLRKEKTLKSLVVWWVRAARLLGDPVPATPPRLATLKSQTLLQLAEELSWSPSATLVWTNWWLPTDTQHPRLAMPGSGSGVYGTRTLRAHLCGYYQEDGGVNHGFSPDLIFEEAPGDEDRLFVHPASCLLLCSEEWLRALQVAKGKLKKPVSWRLEVPDNLESRRRVFFGKSHGAAAARVLSDLRHGKYPDDGVLVLASIRPGLGGQTMRTCTSKQSVGSQQKSWPQRSTYGWIPSL
jgi:hypothetical protein